MFDDRGHFVEPHTERSIGLGTIAVREYLAERREPWLNEAGLSPASIITHGPEGCFSAVLFVEKEGFTPLFEAVQLRERYDIAIMSTKGMSVVAARTLIDRLGVPAFVLHDFDKAGFSIAGTLQRDTRRYEFGGEIKIIDIGLRLDDVMALGLEGKAESVFDRGNDDAKRENLRLNGATDEEVEFLLHRRVELNALTSDQLVAFIESKLDVHGIKKLVPPKALLDDAYQLFVRSRRIERIITEALANDSGDRAVEAPEDIIEQVRDYLAENPHLRWDEAVAALVNEE